MHPEKYSLTWHTYSDHLKSMMKKLMMNEDFSDVTLVTEDKKQIKANINILSACSPIFKDFLKKDKGFSTVMYLRGIQFSEMESIMQFIYLGEATFYEEKMDEFIAVAKSLEIKEICNAEPEANDEPEIKKEQTDHKTKLAPYPRRREVVRVNWKYECEVCQKKYSDKTSLDRHKQSVHEGVTYACDQCDYQAARQYNLTLHIQSKHEGVKYACDQCNQQFTLQFSLTRHIHSTHEGVKYACDQCDYQAGYQGDLTKHKRKVHETI